MANTTKQTTTTTEEKKFTVMEFVEGTSNVFCIGLAKDKNGKNVYARKVEGANGKPDTKKTKVMVKFCLPARKDTENEQAKFISAAITLENATFYKETGIDLSKKNSTPLRVRYSLNEYFTEDGVYHMLREIVNVGVYNAETKAVDWMKKSAKPQAEATPVVEEVSEEDLPF